MVKTDQFQTLAPDLVFETSWEVCNKIGGIYTVLSTKAGVLGKSLHDRLIEIGPYFGAGPECSPSFEPDGTDTPLARACATLRLPFGITARAGRWNIPGKSAAVLIDFRPVLPHINEIFGQMWEKFRVDSLHSYGDYPEGCAFGVAAAFTIAALSEASGAEKKKTIAHFHEWTTGMGLLKLREIAPDIASVFTTHATSIGRSICGNGKPLYDYLDAYNGNQMAAELNMEAKHSLERTAAWQADCFTTVSDVTAKECRQLLDIAPQVVTPNGFDKSFVPRAANYKNSRTSARARLLAVASSMYSREFNDKDTFIVATSGRNEFRNKGLDLFLDAIQRLGELDTAGKQILACIFVPCWTAGVNTSPDADNFFSTHRLHNEDSDPLFIKAGATVRSLGGESRVALMLVPCYLDGNDGVINLTYYNMLPGADCTVFASYYEPWGYTPLESIAFHVPTVTTDKSGFGLWALSEGRGTLASGGVEVIDRTDSNYDQAKEKIARTIAGLTAMPAAKIAGLRKKAAATANMADWDTFIKRYHEAFGIAFMRRNSRMGEARV